MSKSGETMIAMMLDEPNAEFRRVEIAHPAPGAGEVLVRIHASAVNPLDLKIRAGAAAHALHRLPAILGIDMAGVVESVGTGVSRFQPGDEVYGMTGGVGGVQGSLAEYAAVDADLLAIKPANLSMREAAALPLITITAWEGLVDRAGMARGQTVLIQGGAGGVGHVAVQIALALGARVFATVRPSDAGYISSIGAIAIDRDMSAEQHVARFTNNQGFDIVYDTVGGPILDKSFAVVRRFGHVVSALGWGTHALAPLSFKSGTYSGVFTLLPLLTGEGRRRHGEILTEAAGFVEAGKLAPRLDPRHFELADAAAAHGALEAGSAHGKVVIDVIRSFDAT
jgi:NADPH2:quinone reductase